MSMLLLLLLLLLSWWLSDAGGPTPWTGDTNERSLEDGPAARPPGPFWKQKSSRERERERERSPPQGEQRFEFPKYLFDNKNKANK